ncbi:hypothetical protein [Anaerotignum propionicum]|uniref:hypothetical protein n=1 Tax=Anaerotignum propionicum TaxID=28446 RepID=UPI002896884F|nr:hypothetical protein [Anaerotignum propionicum]
MNPLKIESSSILSVRYAISLHSLMQDYIDSNDKEPSWDGFIYLYKSNDLKVEDLKYRVPVQVKGKNAEELLNKNAINYKVQYKHLRNYYQDGGIFYIVAVISDDGKRTSIFYNSLTTIKLADILKGKEGKKPEQEKNIPLLRLEKNDSKKLYEVLSQFGLERQKQGSGNGEIVKNAININDLDYIDCIQASSFSAKSEIDILKEISTGEISIYGHRADLDMWLPFDYSHQMELEFIKIFTMNKTIGIDGITYYDSYLVEAVITEDDDKPVIRVSENLILDLLKGTFHFDIIGDIFSLYKDVQFFKALQQGKTLYVDNKKVIDVQNVKISKKFKNEIDQILDLHSAFIEIGYVCKKRFADFTDENRKFINELLKIYNRKIRPKEGCNSAWFMWHWDDKVVPLFLVYNEEKKLDVVNWFTTNKYGIYVEKGKKYALPRFSLFKRDILEKLYDVDEQIWIEEFEKTKFIENIIDEIIQSFLELVAAYDKTYNQVYFDVANMIVDKILELSPENEYGIINKMQLIKRKRQLNENEILKLEDLESKSVNPMTKCAVNILLENKRNAKKILDELPEEIQNEMRSYPIYSLL